MSTRKRTNRKVTAKKAATTKTPPIRITVPREDRLKTIHSLAETVAVLARALNATASISVSHCYFDATGREPSLSIENGEPETRMFEVPV